MTKQHVPTLQATLDLRNAQAVSNESICRTARDFFIQLALAAINDDTDI